MSEFKGARSLIVSWYMKVKEMGHINKRQRIYILGNSFKIDDKLCVSLIGGGTAEAAGLNAWTGVKQHPA